MSIWIMGITTPLYPQGVWITYDIKVGFIKPTSDLTLEVIHLSTGLIITTRQKVLVSVLRVRGKKSRF